MGHSPGWTKLWDIKQSLNWKGLTLHTSYTRKLQIRQRYQENPKYLRIKQYMPKHMSISQRNQQGIIKHSQLHKNEDIP
jgi:hypothetical protein